MQTVVRAMVASALGGAWISVRTAGGSKGGAASPRQIRPQVVLALSTPPVPLAAGRADRESSRLHGGPLGAAAGTAGDEVEHFLLDPAHRPVAMRIGPSWQVAVIIS